MGCRCVYPAHIGVGDIYVVADARLACADQGKPDMGVGVAADLPALPADCVQCLGWKGWRLLANVLACLAVRTLLSVPATLLIAFTLQDLLK
ncbi:hypothetical protein NM3042_2028 [Neisseria meningitidis NM3042]|nr:hypothetical protein NM3042_2028 [Neisseria meningitidis NM3042]